jgi:maltose O-acetyltransferase
MWSHVHQREKMLRGELYDASDRELVALRLRGPELWQRLNFLPGDAFEARRELLRTLLGECGDGAVVEPPFFCDYGAQIHLGPGVYVNMNCVFLDPAAIHVGAQTFIGPAVQLYTASHPLDAARVAGPELAFPIRIGGRVWVGGGTVVCPGVTIGDDTTIGAGSVVTRDIPAGVVAVGNPCRVVRSLR